MLYFAYYNEFICGIPGLKPLRLKMYNIMKINITEIKPFKTVKHQA